MLARSMDPTACALSCVHSEGRRHTVQEHGRWLRGGLWAVCVIQSTVRDISRAAYDGRQFALMSWYVENGTMNPAFYIVGRAREYLSFCRYTVTRTITRALETCDST